MAMFNVMVQFSAKAELTTQQLAFFTHLGADDVEFTDEDAENGVVQYRCWVYDMAKLATLVAYAETL